MHGPYDVNPSDADIAKAIALGQYDDTPYDEWWKGKEKEWNTAKTIQDVQKHALEVKQYHARRVAACVRDKAKWEKGDPHPIQVNQGNEAKAGNHRLRAALYLNLPEIEVERV